jgi:thioester reductase-like protein
VVAVERLTDAGGEGESMTCAQCSAIPEGKARIITRQKMGHVHLVTGGTGVVGAALILELLTQTDAQIYCLVRPGTTHVEERLQTALAHAVGLYGYAPTLVHEVHKRCHAIAGDVTLDNCGVYQKIEGKIAHFWHSAASLRFLDRFAAEIFATNTQGTRHAVDLAQRLDVGCFNYMSTAYVVGKQAGRILEQPVTAVDTNNVYEQSKITAEKVMYGLATMHTRIFRPSIVIGHSTTHGILNCSGLYGFMRKLLQFKGMMERLQPGLLAREGIRMRVDPEIPLNFIPLDIVAQQAVCISQTASPAPIFHLTNSQAPTAGEFLASLFAAIELDPPIFVETTDSFTWADAKLYEQMEFYNSYLIGNKLFDRSHSDAALGNPTPYGFPLPAATLRAFYQWYLEELMATRKDLPVSR